MTECMELNKDETLKPCTIMKDNITLVKENVKLKEQIEKMKCCCKCKYYQGALCECTNQVYVFKASGKCNEWELAE